MKNAKQRGVQIEERTDKTQRHNKVAGHVAVKKKDAKKFSEQKEEKHTAAAKQKTVADTFADGPADSGSIPDGIGFCHQRHQQHGDRIGKRSGKKNQSHSHARKNAVDGKRLADAVSELLKSYR